MYSLMVFFSQSDEESDDLGSKVEPVTKQMEVEKPPKKRRSVSKKRQVGLPRAAMVGSVKVLIGQTPVAIRK